MGNPPVVLLLRGHIRESFKDKRLFNLLNELCKRYDVKLYIHTWNKYSSNLSWRRVETNNASVSILDIRTYISGLDCEIRGIEIDDDSKIELNGDITGNIFSTLLPKLAWKRMWYGINKMMEIINNSEDPTTLVVNTRFDLFNNSFSEHNIDSLLDLINKNIGLSLTENKFLRNSNMLLGIDNFYIGLPNIMYRLVNNFHTNLDSINSRYKDIYFQEVTVFYENSVLFNNDPNEKKFENIGLYFTPKNVDENGGFKLELNPREKIQMTIETEIEYLKDVDSQIIKERGLCFLNNLNSEERYSEQRKVRYSLISQTVRDKPFLEVKHTKSDWKGFGKKR